MKIRYLSPVVLGLLAVGEALAQSNNVPIPYTDATGIERYLAAQCNGGAPNLCSFQSTPQIASQPVAPGNPMPVVIEPAGVLPVTSQPNNATSAYASPVTVGTASTMLVAAGGAKSFLDIQNGCTTQNMTISVGGSTARVLTPLATYTREAGFVPADLVTATVASGSCPAYVAAK